MKVRKNLLRYDDFYDYPCFLHLNGSLFRPDEDRRLRLVEYINMGPAFLYSVWDAASLKKSFMLPALAP